MVLLSFYKHRTRGKILNHSSCSDLPVKVNILPGKKTPELPRHKGIIDIANEMANIVKPSFNFANRHFEPVVGKLFHCKDTDLVR